LINADIKEEVLYREALAMGLDKDDTIVRRRLAQKVEFLIADISAPSEVNDSDLMAFYENNATRYSRSAVLSFRHIYFNPEQRGERTLDEASATLQSLQATKAGSEVEDELGDRFLLHSWYQQQTTDQIARDFGREFAEELVTLEPGAWHGPLESSYGLHLVFIDERLASGTYPFAEVRERVRDDYLFELRQSQNEAVVEKLKSRYEIVVEQD
jgi:peptidyl-prolyl cis-trans isomerase C